jgi:hypothetical protein
MAARTATTTATATAPVAKTRKPRTTIIDRARAAKSKSEGARMLLDGGFKIKEIGGLLEMNYAFVYGVASRHGVAMTAADRRSTKAPAAPVKAPRAPRTTPSTAKGAAVLAERTKPGRPSAARRQANRASAKA